MSEQIAVDHRALRAYEMIRYAIGVLGEQGKLPPTPEGIAIFTCDCVAAMEAECVKRGWQRTMR